MKKLMTLMLGLSLVFGSVALADDKAAGDKKADAGKEKKKGGKKKGTEKPADAK